MKHRKDFDVDFFRKNIIFDENDKLTPEEKAFINSKMSSLKDKSKNDRKKRNKNKRIGNSYVFPHKKCIPEKYNRYGYDFLNNPEDE